MVIFEGLIRPVHTTKIMRIDSNWSRPHGMRIDLIRIESELHQSTYRGGLNAN